MMASKTSVVEFDSATSHSSEADRSDPFEDSFRKLPFHYHGLSICCYAPLQPHMQHYTCSDCSTVFNIVRSKLLLIHTLERSNDTEGARGLLWDRHIPLWVVPIDVRIRDLLTLVRVNERLCSLPALLALCEVWGKKAHGPNDIQNRAKARLVTAYNSFGR